MNEAKLNNRNYILDILKFLAVILVINSHIDIAYAECSYLATGGAIADALFLFITGFLSFSKMNEPFLNWYKSRIARIYPSVFVCTILTASILKTHFINISSFWGGEFIIALMTYYIIIYMYHYAFQKRLNFYIPIITIIFFSFIFYIFNFKSLSHLNIYGTETLFRWVPFSALMFMGMNIASKKDNLKLYFPKDILMLFFLIILFYGLQNLHFISSSLEYMKIFSIVPLTFIPYYLYKVFANALIEKIYRTKIITIVINFIAGVCLESYLIQYTFITDKYNNLFPFNILIIMVQVILISYLAKCLSKIFKQTFSEKKYDIKDIMRLY